MIRKQDLEAAIAECQGKRNPDARTCIMLAAFYTIQREMFGEAKEDERYSFAAAPVQNTIDIDTGSEFAAATRGKSVEDVMPIMDELMSTIQIIQPRLYDAVMMKLS